MFVASASDAQATPVADRRRERRRVARLERVDQASDSGNDDLSCDDVTAVPRGRDSHGDVSSVLGEIDERIVAIEAELASVAPLAVERERLLRARAALLGEPPPSLGPARRATRDDVAEYLARNPASRAGEIARGLGTSQQVVSAHLYRGKATRFVNRGGRWYLREG